MDEDEVQHMFADEQSALEALYVTNNRILDVLYALLLTENKEYAMLLINKHAAGGLIGPDTAFVPSELL